MENMDKKECGGGMCGNMCGGKGSCGCGGGMPMHDCHGGKHFLVKIILKLVIVIMIFWLGFSLGQITGSIKAQYGRGMMRDGGAGWGMMRSGYYNSSVTLPGATGAETTTTPKK